MSRSVWNPNHLPLGEAIYLTRRALNLTGPGLSRKSGVHRNTLLRIESGSYAPSVSTVIVIAEALGVEVSTIFHRAEKLRPAQRMVLSVAGDKSK